MLYAKRRDWRRKIPKICTQKCLGYQNLALRLNSWDWTSEIEQIGWNSRAWTDEIGPLGWTAESGRLWCNSYDGTAGLNRWDWSDGLNSWEWKAGWSSYIEHWTARIEQLDWTNSWDWIADIKQLDWTAAIELYFLTYDKFLVHYTHTPIKPA